MRCQQGVIEQLRVFEFTKRKKKKRKKKRKEGLRSNRIAKDFDLKKRSLVLCGS